MVAARAEGGSTNPPGFDLSYPVGSVTETHQCEWRGRAEELASENTALKDRLGSVEHQLEALARAVFGKKSEKLPPIREQLRDGTPADPQATLKKRRAARAAREELPTRESHHRVPTEKRHCPKCGSTDLRPLGRGAETVVYEYIPARLERQIHVQEKLACACGEGIVTAEAPKAVEGGQYGPGLMAHVAVSKCLDSIPLYRQAKALARVGVPIHRNTLGDLFHRSADLAVPLYERLLELIRLEDYVRADETPQRVLAPGKTRRAYVWTFRTEKLIAYVHAHGRSGSTAVAVLGGTKGYVQVDAYSGYNAITTPEGRLRVGCWAHVRRRFFDALSKAPEAQRALDLILELYRVDAEVDADGQRGTDVHREARRDRSAAALRELSAWLTQEQPKHPPKSPIGEAIQYTRSQWDALTRFLEDPRLALDNNASEGALRPLALGRKNYLFVGHDEAGENLAALMSLLATCEANGVNPIEYLADVLLRVSTHPASRLDELLPHRWRPPDLPNAA